MKKSTTILYVAVMLSIIIGSCTPCDDGDPEEASAVVMNNSHIDSTAVN